MKRRTFLKMAGMGAVTFVSGCSTEPERTIYALVESPEDMVTGQAVWYASTCRECPAGCGVIAKNREGRLIKLEGNPFHPINRGKLCMRGQAALQGVYNPDRIKQPLLKTDLGFKPLSFERATRLLEDKTTQAVSVGPNRVAVMTETVGDTLYSLLKSATDRFNSSPPLVFETFAHENLKNAYQQILNVVGLPAIAMDKSDCLVSFGADFLETWLSPVQYGRKFKSMHQLSEEGHGRFFFVSPYQSLTGANADLYLPCNPGGETIIALGLVRAVLRKGRGQKLPADIYRALDAVTQDLSPDEVARLSGVNVGFFKALRDRLLAATAPLVLGAGNGVGDLNGLPTEMAVVWLNLVLDPDLTLFDFENRQRVEMAAGRSQIRAFFEAFDPDGPDEGLGVLLLNNVNPAYSLPERFGVAKALLSPRTFVVSFTNFMDETARLADLIIPVKLPLESWDAYSGQGLTESLLQPAMGILGKAPHIGDLILKTAFGHQPPAPDYKTYLMAHLKNRGLMRNQNHWLAALGQGGFFNKQTQKKPQKSFKPSFQTDLAFFDKMVAMRKAKSHRTVFAAVPSNRFFDGRGTNRPWLNEIPDTLTQAAWQAPVCAHPQTLSQKGLKVGDEIRLRSRWGAIKACVYASENMRPGLWVMAVGQGRSDFGRYAKGIGANPFSILPDTTDIALGKGLFAFKGIRIMRTGQNKRLAFTSGSRATHGRKIALTVPFKEIKNELGHAEANPGLTMDKFPLTLPLTEGYDPKRDFYPPHKHDTYRWAMVIDLDRCIGCSACVAACYAENNIGVTGAEQIAKGREMAWLQIQAYTDPLNSNKQIFLPMMCQHCDNAPCESVCPVYAPHHSKEGLNNQIYNRCIGTRFCAQNCPYKVRRFNWLSWEWPKPLDLQLNPNVTVRAKGVMEKCSFCIQRIKAAHNTAKNDKRLIADGEVVPACMQTCPTEAIFFGNLMDKKSRVRQLAADARAYQVMGYLNTKTAVIYLKKVVREI